MNEATLLQQPSRGQMHHAKAEAQTSKTTKLRSRLETRYI